MSFKDWLIDTITVDVVPSPVIPYVMLVLSSFAGGWIYAHSGSWTYAIVADAIAYFWLWFGVRPLVERIGKVIVQVVLFVLP
jgi:hypothetical protein